MAITTLVTDTRSGVSLVFKREFQNRPAISLQIRSNVMYLDRGQDRRTLIKVRDELTRLLRLYEKPLRRDIEVRDPAVCRQCGYLDQECRCEQRIP